MQCHCAFVAVVDVHHDHKATQWPHMDMMTNEQACICISIRSVFFFLFLLLKKKPLWLDDGYVYRNHKHHDEKWLPPKEERATTGCREGMTGGTPHFNTQHQWQHHQRRRGSSRGRGSRRDTSRIPGMPFFLFFFFFFFTLIMIIIIYQTDDAG